MALKIYTKTGDKGTTALIGGTRVPKSHLRIDSYGTVDELNSWIGVVRDHLGDEASRSTLSEIQDRLFTLGSALACDPEKEPKLKIPDLKTADVELLEREIDRMNETLEPMRAFILPGGAPSVSFLHVARCVCRRAERLCVALQEVDGDLEILILQYLNRLSDYLFVLARWAAHLSGVEEIKWKPRV
ncbi:cob(I)yrinic acid a,c-diamide adenosyltransferase [Flaviaesturariibacter amylovorans]|uniref:Corrinoid adenosyltransferase n=1 Tax=Flaviaesturariibacter amylovorans TaxID=1084520 RepID=A0ABP8HCY9_9BACT